MQPKQRIKQVEELFLRALLPRKEMHVVKQQRADALVPGPPGTNLVDIDRMDELVNEVLSGLARYNCVRLS